MTPATVPGRHQTPCWCLLLSCLSALGAPFPYSPANVHPPAVAREFRGAWIATVANIDWPSSPDLSVADQKAELRALLDRAQTLKLNAVIFQVRPACDAMYSSSLEPWSEYLTGTMGRKPEPFYDPLEFAVREAHDRGLELHAWFNPYRARHRQARSAISANHISRTKPHLVREYGKYLWLDPGEREVQDHSLAVVLDVVKRYDIDGVHFDDYFYPYAEKDAQGNDLDFPDAASWKRFGAGGKLSRADWRRENVNSFLERVSRAIKQSKPWVEFGVSPFGIWRPGNPPQIDGYDAYEKLYADSRLWLKRGWVDYLAPQLYWAIDAPEQSFPVLLKWWAGQNPMRRGLYPGLNSANTPRRWKPEEIARQIDLTRKQAGAGGHIHWNMRALMRPGLPEALSTRYAQPALPPAMTWLDATPPGKPALNVRNSGSETQLTWSGASGEKAFLWVLQTKSGKNWTTEILPADARSRTFRNNPEAVALSAVDRAGNISPHSGYKRK